MYVTDRKLAVSQPRRLIDHGADRHMSLIRFRSFRTSPRCGSNRINSALAIRGRSVLTWEGTLGRESQGSFDQCTGPAVHPAQAAPGAAMSVQSLSSNSSNWKLCMGHDHRCWITSTEEPGILQPSNHHWEVIIHFACKLSD